MVFKNNYYTNYKELYSYPNTKNIYYFKFIKNTLKLINQEKEISIMSPTLIELSNTHSYIISVLTFVLSFFFINPSIILNGTQLISLTIFNL